MEFPGDTINRLLKDLHTEACQTEDPDLKELLLDTVNTAASICNRIIDQETHEVSVDISDALRKLAEEDW